MGKATFLMWILAWEWERGFAGRGLFPFSGQYRWMIGGSPAMGTEGEMNRFLLIRLRIHFLAIIFHFMLKLWPIHLLFADFQFLANFPVLLAKTDIDYDQFRLQNVSTIEEERQKAGQCRQFQHAGSGAC